MEREILNHRCLVHPHIVQFKEVSTALGVCTAQLACLELEHTYSHTTLPGAFPASPGMDSAGVCCRQPDAVCMNGVSVAALVCRRCS